METREELEAQAADDERLNERQSQKLEKGEASQAHYIEFQKMEAGFRRPMQLIQLAYQVVDEMDDTRYAAQLLSGAEEKMRESGFDLDRYRPLIIAVSQLAKDDEWTTRLLDESAQNCQFFAQLNELGNIATRNLADIDAGKAWAEKLYASWESKLDESEARAYEYIKLARVVKTDIGDDGWAGKLIDKATGKACDHFQYAYIAELVKSWGDDERALDLYQKAADICDTETHCYELVHLLRKTGVSEEKQRELYAQGGSKLVDAWKRLRWVEGIMLLFKDTDWAGEAYASLENDFSEGAARKVFENSKRNRLGEQCFW